MEEGTSVTWTRVDAQGRVVIPAEIRGRFEIDPGSRIAFLIEDGELKLMTVDQGVERAQRLARKTSGWSRAGRLSMSSWLNEDAKARAIRDHPK